MIPSFLTHYYEAERGPFKNICDLSDDELDGLISVEKNADIAFNRFALGRDFSRFGSAPYFYSYEPVRDLLLTYDEFPEAVHTYSLDSRIARAKRLNMWVSSYIEAHIWDPDIRNKIGV
jgi:hypothetical protein